MSHYVTMQWQNIYLPMFPECRNKSHISTVGTGGGGGAGLQIPLGRGGSGQVVGVSATSTTQASGDCGTARQYRYVLAVETGKQITLWRFFGLTEHFLPNKMSLLASGQEYACFDIIHRVVPAVGRQKCPLKAPVGRQVVNRSNRQGRLKRILTLVKNFKTIQWLFQDLRLAD